MKKETYTKLKPIKGGVAGCANCGYTEDVLPMDTVLYQGFGGWHITKNGEHYFSEDINKEWEENKKLSSIEEEARKEPNKDWRAHCILPLRDAVYQRQRKDKWVLVEKGQGFA